MIPLGSSVGRVATFALNYKTSYGAIYADRARPVTATVADGPAERPMWIRQEDKPSGR
jgi:hypothetical protein